MSTTFHKAETHEDLIELFQLAGTQWNGILSGDNWALGTATEFEKLAQKGKQPQGFYLRHIGTKQIVASVVVTKFQGYYKAIDNSLVKVVPDLTTIGLNPATFLRVGYVFTRKENRGEGLAELLIKRVIELVEGDIITENLSKSKPGPQGFKSLVTNEKTGEIDPTLANYYLGKQYFWTLYSAIGTFYERFGFKAYPLDFYQITTPLKLDLVEQLLAGGAHTGKKLRLLRGDNPGDKAFIEFIYQNKEIEIIADLNRSLGHSELSGSRKSSSSLVNVGDALDQVRSMGSTNALANIGESAVYESSTSIGSPETRKQSVALQQRIPKVALKPDTAVLEELSGMTTFLREHAETGQTDEQIDYSKVWGACLENELQQKTYYVLWCELQNRLFTIVAIGELKSDFFSGLFDSTSGNSPLLSGGQGRRRSSNLSGLNEMGGYNFQDLDILISTASFVAEKRKVPEKWRTFLSVQDLPATIPAPVLHDYFLNFGAKSGEKSSEVKFIEDADKQMEILPMLKRFGNSSPEFELDWLFNSMIYWG